MEKFMQEFYERLRNPERYGPSQEEKDTCDAIVKTMLESYYTKANREELKRRIKKKEGYSVQYARGGESMLNGFYSRSLLTETVVSNVSRGKLLTRLTDKVPDYIYYFDEANRLSLVCRHPDTQYTEFTLVEISDDCEFTLGNFRAETNKEKAYFSIVHIGETRYENGRPAEHNEFWFSPRIIKIRNGIPERDFH